MASLPVLMSKFIHPLVHQPERLVSAPLFLKKLIKTRFMKKIFYNHYMHHLHLDTNFNLLLGGDYLVGAHRKMTIQESREVKAHWQRFEQL